MSIVYRCDRCKTEDDQFVRNVTAEYVGVDLSTIDEDPGPWHLCDDCASQLRQFINEKRPLA